MVLLISYDLNQHERPASYTAVRRVIEQHAVSAIRPLYSQWLVDTTDSPQTWTNRLRTVMDANDYLLVVRVYRDSYWGWLTKEMWSWLEARL